jgi:hypothetical protein
MITYLAAHGYNTSTGITDALASIVKREIAKNTDPQRFKEMMVEVAPHNIGKESDCVKSHLMAEDNAPVRRSGKTDPMIFESLTLTCTHPNAKIILVHVEYSQRYNPGQSDPRFLEKAMNVLNSIEFTPL